MNVDGRLRRGDVPFAAACGVVAAFLVACVLFPLACTFSAVSPGTVATVLRSARFMGAARNTLLSCVCATALSVLLGYLYAFFVTRAGIPCRRLFAAVPVVHLVTPPFVGGLSFILLLGRQGFITKTLLGLDVSLYGFWGLLIAQVLCFFPIAYLMCRESLEGVNPDLEQVARGMGASRARVFCTVTLPLSLPGITSSALFIAVSVLSDFGNPLIVAGRYRVLATEVYTQLTGWLDAGTSASLGLLLLAPSLVLFALYSRTVRKSAVRVATVGGRSSLPSGRGAQGRAIRVCGTVFCAAVSLAVAAQFAAIVAGSVQTLWGVNAKPTLAHLARSVRYMGEVRNTLAFSAVAAALGTVLASFAAYFANRAASRPLAPLAKATDALAQLPAAVPGSLMGLSLSLAANRLGIVAPPLLIVVAMTVAFMPFSYRIMTDSLLHLRTTLDDGARSLGAGRLRVLATVLVPLCRGGLFSSFAYSFIRGVGTLSSVIFLVSFNTPLASVRILNLAEQGDWGAAAALSLVLTLVAFAVLALTGRLVPKGGIQNAA